MAPSRQGPLTSIQPRDGFPGRARRSTRDQTSTGEQTTTVADAVLAARIADIFSLAVAMFCALGR